MGMTMTQKILARHAGLKTVEAGQLVEGKLDLVLGNDITTPVAIAEFNKAGLTRIFDQDRIALILDHYTPCKDIKAAQLCATVREFAKQYQITHFYDVGDMGVEHALVPEKGWPPPARLSSAPTPIPVLTGPWVPFPQAWAPPIWRQAWLRAWPGSKSPRRSRSP